MRFATKNTSDANAIYRYVIDSDGSILPYSSNSYDIGKTGQQIRNIYSANAVTVGSDRRLKTDIEDTPLGLDFINALRPVAYRLIVGDRTVTMEQETDENGEPLFVDVQDGTEQVRVGMDEHGEPIFEERPVIRREPKLRETVTTRPGARTHYGLIAQEVKETLDSVADGCLRTKTTRTASRRCATSSSSPRSSRPCRNSRPRLKRSRQKSPR